MVDCADHERLAEAKVELDVSYLYGLTRYTTQLYMAFTDRNGLNG